MRLDTSQCKHEGHEGHPARYGSRPTGSRNVRSANPKTVAVPNGHASSVMASLNIGRRTQTSGSHHSLHMGEVPAASRARAFINVRTARSDRACVDSPRAPRTQAASLMSRARSAVGWVFQIGNSGRGRSRRAILAICRKSRKQMPKATWVSHPRRSLRPPSS